MGNTTNQYLFGVVKLNLPLKVERVELAPLVFVPSFVIGIFILATLATFISKRPEKIEQISKANPGRKISVSNLVGDMPADEDILGSESVSESVKNVIESHEENNDCIGWLHMEDTNVDYPVMQTMGDEEYYLNRDFNGNSSSAGSLIMDTDSTVGTGTLSNEYTDGSKPSTNLIIHGHNMRNGSMFGSLDKFRDKEYAKEHNIIKFSTQYEDREYEVISVFTSQVFLKTQTDVFKYYKFFEANTKEEFDDFYNNIKKLQLYDTGVTAEYGDEFITLSVCAYHVENGRFVVVGKRIN